MVNKEISWVKYLIYLIFVFNVVLFMYPAQLAGDTIINAFALSAVNYINPLVLAGALVALLPGGHVFEDRLYMLAAVGASLAMEASSLQAENFKSSCIGIFFIISALILAWLRRINTEILSNLFEGFLLCWVTVPVVLLLNPSWWDAFINYPEVSFHGFADSRIMYGLWSAVAALLLLSKSYYSDRLRYAAGFLVSVGIYMSQSRAAVLAVAIAGVYWIARSDKLWKEKLTRCLGVLFLVVLVFSSWKLYGRQEPFQFANSTRTEIAGQYLKNVDFSNPWFGAGHQVNVVIGGVETQAHNFLIQWFVNWGFIGLASFLIYIFALWRLCESRLGKMLLLVLFVFSLTQPIQGTANFFGPVTLCFLLFVAMVESRYRLGAGLYSVPTFSVA